MDFFSFITLWATNVSKGIYDYTLHSCYELQASIFVVNVWDMSSTYVFPNYHYICHNVSPKNKDEAKAKDRGELLLQVVV